MGGLKVLAAMSGGVDSATAAARAVDAGHEVTGVHLALSANPSSYRTGARGCCTLEDARDARRAADVIGIPSYVWDMAERFHRDVIEDFVAEYAAGRSLASSSGSGSSGLEALSTTFSAISMTRRPLDLATLRSRSNA